MGFSQSDAPEENDVAAVLYEVQTEDVLHLEAVDLLGPAESETDPWF